MENPVQQQQEIQRKKTKNWRKNLFQQFEIQTTNIIFIFFFYFSISSSLTTHCLLFYSLLLSFLSVQILNSISSVDYVLNSLDEKFVCGQMVCDSFLRFGKALVY